MTAKGRISRKKHTHRSERKGMKGYFAQYDSDYYASPEGKKAGISVGLRRRVLAELMLVAKKIEKRRNRIVQSEDAWRRQFNQVLNQIFIVKKKTNKEA